MLFKVDLETWILIVPLRTSLLATRLLDIVAKRASFASKYIKNNAYATDHCNRLKCCEAIILVSISQRYK